MYCSYCGKEVAAGSRFCANCGAAVNNPPAGPSQAPSSTAQWEFPAVERMGNPGGDMTGSGGRPEERKEGTSKKPLMIIAAVLVLIVGFGAALSLYRDRSEPDSGPDIPSGLDVNTSDTPEGTTAEAGTFSLDWIGSIPVVEREASGLPYADGELEYEFYPFQSGSLEDRLGFSNSEQISYGNADVPAVQGISVSVCTAINDGTGSLVGYAVAYGGNIGAIGSYFELEKEPLIGKRDDGLCLLFYKANVPYSSGYYEIYLLEQNDSADYRGWTLRGQLYVFDSQYFDYMNGSKELEIISIPGQSAQ